jgi:hypothetical protein
VSVRIVVALTEAQRLLQPAQIASAACLGLAGLLTAASLPVMQPQSHIHGNFTTMASVNDIDASIVNDMNTSVLVQHQRARAPSGLRGECLQPFSFGSTHLALPCRAPHHAQRQTNILEVRLYRLMRMAPQLQ